MSESGEIFRIPRGTFMIVCAVSESINVVAEESLSQVIEIVRAPREP